MPSLTFSFGVTLGYRVAFLLSACKDTMNIQKNSSVQFQCVWTVVDEYLIKARKAKG